MFPLRSALTATAAACAASLFAVMDADPILYVADRWFHRRKLLRPNGISYFTNQRIWIIGASSGIGEELAYQLAADGGSNTHLILSSRSKDKLESIAQSCRESNPDCIVTVLPLDVCQHDDLKAAVQQVSQQYQPIDTVILNAGGGHLSPALETSVETAESVWRLNALWPMVLTPLLLEKRSSPFFKERPHLVVTSSIAGILPVPLSATYAAAKHAVQGYFRSVKAERPDLRLQIVMPGPVDTNFHPKPDNSNESNSSNQLKMPVQRCARLIRSTMMLPSSRESWVAQQPVLAALYLQQLVPTFMQNAVYNRIGPKRVAMWRAGLDLYDPASWTKLKQHQRDDNVDDDYDK